MPATFLNTPLGVLCLVVLGLVSLINIYAHWIEDGLVGRLLYMALALTCAAGFMRWTDSYMTTAVGVSLIVIFALLSLRNVTVKSVRYFKHRRKYDAKKHFR